MGACAHGVWKCGRCPSPRPPPVADEDEIPVTYYVIREGAAGSTGRRWWYSSVAGCLVWTPLPTSARPFPTLEAAHLSLTRLRGSYEIRRIVLRSEAVS